MAGASDGSAPRTPRGQDEPSGVVHARSPASRTRGGRDGEAREADVASFRFKAVRPTFDGPAIRVNGQRNGNEVKLWAQDHEGWLTMDAAVTLR